jgi:lysophospholipase L1-like esterase
MSGLKMSAFVSDYDHNAPTHEYLASTHHKLYLKIREKNPDIPYFMITRPDFYFDSDCIGRRDIIMKSYLEARRNGDKNVYFIDGSAFFNGENVEDLTLDLTHPNDEGFRRMANYIGDVISKVMKL